MKKIQNVENLQDRFERYSVAKTKLENWKPLLEETYKYVFPNREAFYSETSGMSKSDEIFDETAVIGGIQFANNLQSLLMPPFKRWVSLEAGDLLTGSNSVNDDEIKQINQKLQKDTEVLFRNLESSNFNYVMNEAFQDVCVGTAVIVVNEGSLNQPFEFLSIPISDVCFEEDEKGQLNTVWREISLSLRQVKQKWPDAVLTQSLQSLLQSDPNQIKTFIEGCIYVPENDEESKYVYYVSTDDGKEEIVKPQFREFSPFTVARYSKMPGEIWGRGVAQLGLSAIKVLNKIAEFELRAQKFKAYPAYIAANTGVLNPFNISIEPGSVIAVTPDFSGGDPIKPLQGGGDVNFMNLSIQEKQNTLRELFFSNPLGPSGDSPKQTATEVSIRQQNFIRQNGAAVGRLAYEFIQPIIEKCLIILRRKGLIRDIDTSIGKMAIKVNNKVISIKYSSPLLDVQNQEDVQNFVQYLEMLMQTFGSTGLIAVEMFKIPMAIAEKMGIDLDLVKSEVETEAAFKNIQQAQQQQQQQQEAPGLGAQGIPAQQQIGITGGQ